MSLTAIDLIPLIDLTSLNTSDDTASIDKLCQTAVTPMGSAAAVCVYPKFVSTAKEALADTGVLVATVSNFPEGNQSLHQNAECIEQALIDGADEIDVVFPYQAFLSGNEHFSRELVESSRSLCGNHVTLKIILETGALVKPGVIAAAAKIAIDAGADFIKTSTGKISTGATLSAARAILQTIREKTERRVGFKVSGGVRTVENAITYTDLVEEVVGAEWLTPSLFRIGASSLWDQVLASLPGSIS